MTRLLLLVKMIKMVKSERFLSFFLFLEEKDLDARQNLLVVNS